MRESFGFNVKFHYHLDISCEGLHVRGLFTPATRSSEDILLVVTVLGYIFEAGMSRPNLDDMFCGGQDALDRKWSVVIRTDNFIRMVFEDDCEGLLRLRFCSTELAGRGTHK